MVVDKSVMIDFICEKNIYLQSCVRLCQGMIIWLETNQLLTISSSPQNTVDTIFAVMYDCTYCTTILVVVNSRVTKRIINRQISNLHKTC